MPDISGLLARVAAALMGQLTMSHVPVVHYIFFFVQPRVIYEKCPVGSLAWRSASNWLESESSRPDGHSQLPTNYCSLLDSWRRFWWQLGRRIPIQGCPNTDVIPPLFCGAAGAGLVEWLGEKRKTNKIVRK